MYDARVIKIHNGKFQPEFVRNRVTPCGVFVEDRYGNLFRYSNSILSWEEIQVVRRDETGNIIATQCNGEWTEVSAGTFVNKPLAPETIATPAGPSEREKLDNLIAYYYHRK